MKTKDKQFMEWLKGNEFQRHLEKYAYTTDESWKVTFKADLQALIAIKAGEIYN